MEKPIIRIKEVLVSENSWLKIYFDEVKFADGSMGSFGRIVEKGGDGIAIVPVNERKEIGLIRIYRYPVDKYLWEIPRGFGEGDTIENEANRELYEETSLKAETLVDLGKLYPNTGILGTAVQIVLASDLTAIEAISDPKEAISDFRFYSLRTIDQLIESGDIRDCISISAIYLARQHLAADFS